jgi:hypothetical protein
MPSDCTSMLMLCVKHSLTNIQTKQCDNKPHTTKNQQNEENVNECLTHCRVTMLMLCVKHSLTFSSFCWFLVVCGLLSHCFVCMFVKNALRDKCCILLYIGQIQYCYPSKNTLNTVPNVTCIHTRIYVRACMHTGVTPMVINGKCRHLVCKLS